MRVVKCDILCGRLQYTSVQLISLCCSAAHHAVVVDRVRTFGLWNVGRLYRIRQHKQKVFHRLYDYRGCRAGRSRRKSPGLFPAGNGAWIILGSRRTSKPDSLRNPISRPSSLLLVHTDRHSAHRHVNVVLGCLNIQSIANKLDDLLEVRRVQQLAVLYLVQTWHDSDSVSVRRLRANCFQVVDRPRPRIHDNTVATNHGGGCCGCIRCPTVACQTWRQARIVRAPVCPDCLRFVVVRRGHHLQTRI